MKFRLGDKVRITKDIIQVVKDHNWARIMASLVHREGKITGFLGEYSDRFPVQCVKLKPLSGPWDPIEDWAWPVSCLQPVEKIMIVFNKKGEKK